MVHLEKKDIEDYIIHRYENFLLDEVDVDPDNRDDNTLKITINQNDSLGRDIFLKQRTKTTKALIVPAYMEILALACITATRKLAPEEMVIFTGISNFKKQASFNEGRLICGQVIKLSDKKGFLKFKGHLWDGDTVIGEGTMMAFFTHVSTQSENSKTVALPPLTLDKHIDKTLFPKSHNMTVCDTIKHISDTEIVTAYTYPDTHPLIKGHFPKNALMMGIMSWLAVEDALTTFCIEKNLSANKQIVTDADIIKADGTLVAEFRAVAVDALFETNDCPNQTEICETKKVTFRNMVKPNETIYIHCKNITIQ
jgi:3-hydroxymyristoyl/3-hydroxydecanoyl-(acyl carrier protein) dehydratase